MRLTLTKAIEYFIYSNILVSLAIAFLSYGIGNQLDIPHTKEYSLFVFGCTLLTYNFQRLTKEKQENTSLTNHLNWVFSNKKLIHILLIISALISFYSFFEIVYWQLFSIFILTISSIICFLYVFKINSKNLRNIPYLKIHIIALICVISIGVFQLINESIFDLKKWLFVLVHYFYLIAVIIPFDIRDLKYDDARKRTIPQILGIKKSKILSLILLALYTFSALYLQPQLIDNFIYILSIIITNLLIINIKKHRNEFYFSGLIEGSILFCGFALGN